MPLYPPSTVGGQAESSVTSSWSTEIETVSSSATGSVYANNKTYVPLMRNANHDVVGGFIAGYAGNVELNVMYAMSSANAGNVALGFAYSAVGFGEAPAPALTAVETIVITPGNDTNVHMLNSTTTASLRFAVSLGDDVTFSLSRVSGSSDTHTGDMRILRMRARQV